MKLADFYVACGVAVLVLMILGQAIINSFDKYDTVGFIILSHVFVGAGFLQRRLERP